MLLLYFAFRGVKFKDLIKDVLSANYWWVLLSLSINVLSLFIRAARWNLLIEPLGKKPSIKYAFHSVVFGYFTNYAAPRLGEVLRCAALSKSEKVPFNSLIGTVVVERTIDLLTVIVLTFTVFFLNINLFGKFINENILGGLSSKVSGLSGFGFIFLILIVLFIIVLFLIIKNHSWLLKFKFYAKTIDFLKGILEGFKTIFKLKKTGWFFAYTILLWTAYFSMAYVLFFSIPYTSNLTPVDGLFILVVASLAMAIPANGGIGAFHWAISLALTIYGLTKEQGLVYATLSHGAQTALFLVLGVISLLVLSIKNKDLLKNDFSAENFSNSAE